MMATLDAMGPDGSKPPSAGEGRAFQCPPFFHDQSSLSGRGQRKR